ncbi:branched-chain amino acid ABC transporter permease [Patulibacter sp. S7RM1-6]
MSVQLTFIATALQFALVGGLLALSTFSALRVGLLSFATVTFAAGGAFVATYAATHWGFGLVGALAAGTVAGALLGLLVAPLALRLESHWLALATVGLMLITRVVVVNVPEATGGSQGEVVPFMPELWQIAVIAAAVCVALARLDRSRFGTAAAATREDPVVADALGIPVRRVYVVAFVLSGAIGGLAGVLQAGLLQYIDPDSFYLDVATAALASVVLGGAYHWAGAVVGAAVFIGLPQYLSQFLAEGEAILTGLLLLAIMVWLPGGLIDPLRRRRARERRAARGATVEPAAAPAGVGR